MKAGLTPEGYTTLQRGFHWLMALAIFITLGLGIVVSQLPRGPALAQVMFFHKSCGVTVLALLVLRVIVRFGQGVPEYRKPLGKMVDLSSKAAHVALYALMVLLPLSGYVVSSAAGRDTSVFGLFTLPNLIARNDALHEAAEGAHFVFAWAIGVLIVLHAAAAIWHGYVKKDEVMARMWPLFPSRAA